MKIETLRGSELLEIQPMFKSVFGHSVSAALLDWKYGEGRGESWVARNDKVPALHCGTLFRDVLLSNEPLKAVQLVDLMANRKTSGLNRQMSPFAVLMRSLLEKMSNPLNPPGLAFGFPSNRAMRLGEHLGVYKTVDHFFDLWFGPLPPQRFGLRCTELTKTIDYTPIEKLWGEMQKDFRDFVIGVRNATYIHHRFIRHPEIKYRIIQLTGAWFRKPVAFAIIRTSEDSGSILDLICAKNTIPEALRALQSWCLMIGIPSLQFSITSRFAQEYSSLAQRCDVTEIRIMGNPFMAKDKLQQLENRWWLTSGDTDYR